MAIIPSPLFSSSPPLSAPHPQTAQQRLFSVTRRQLLCHSVKSMGFHSTHSSGSTFHIVLWMEVIRSSAVRDSWVCTHTRTRAQIL